MGNASTLHGAEATPEQTNPVRGREKPMEIIVGFFNQAIGFRYVPEDQIGALGLPYPVALFGASTKGCWN